MCNMAVLMFAANVSFLDINIYVYILKFTHLFYNL